MRWGWGRRRYGLPGRPKKPRRITGDFQLYKVIPYPRTSAEPLFIDIDELEAIRLIDYDGLDQNSAAEQMGVSRGTVQRLYKSARKKIATMLVEGRILLLYPPVAGGRYDLSSE